MRRILCTGNRFVAGDSAGPLVYDRLAELSLPAGVHAVDAGLAGLNILHWFEGAERVVLVDAVKGFAEPGEVVVLTPESYLKSSPPAHGHAAGLSYALACMPHVLESTPPEVTLIGIEGEPGEAALARAIELCLEHIGPDEHAESAR